MATFHLYYLHQKRKTLDLLQTALHMWRKRYRESAKYPEDFHKVKRSVRKVYRDHLETRKKYKKLLFQKKLVD